MSFISCMIGTKFTQSFRDHHASGRVTPLALAARSPNRMHTERWVRSVKEGVCRRSFSLVNVIAAACGEYVRITMLSAIIRARTTSFCSSPPPTIHREDPVQVAADWGGSAYYHQEAR